MRHHTKCLLALASLVAVLTACGHPSPSVPSASRSSQPMSTTLSTTTTTVPLVTTTTTLSSAAVRWIEQMSAPTTTTGPAARRQVAAARPVPDPHPGPATPHGAPTPVSSRRCPPGLVHDLIVATFGPAAPWAESVAWRESNCRVDVRNGSSGSAGVFQLLGHADLLRAACPNLDPATSWADAGCNVRAAYNLYAAAGTRPWAL